MKQQIFRFMIVVLILVFFVTQNLAFEINFISVTNVLNECANLLVTFDATGVADINDWINRDIYTLVYYDGYGNPYSFSVGAAPIPYTGIMHYMVAIPGPASRPITIKIYDNDSTPFPTSIADAESGRYLDSITFDPADFGFCADLPLITHSHSINIAPFTDGRINNWDMASPVVVYGHDGEAGRGLVIYSPEGVLMLLVSAEEIAAIEECPAENTLIASAGDAALYRLSSCEYQINAPSLDGTKTYVLIFNDLYADTGYTSHEE